MAKKTPEDFDRLPAPRRASNILDRCQVTPRTANFHTDLVNAARREGYVLPRQLAPVLGQTFIDRVREELKAGNHVLIPGFGAFKLVARPDRSGKDVARVRFRPCAQLRDEVAQEHRC